MWEWIIKVKPEDYIETIPDGLRQLIDLEYMGENRLGWSYSKVYRVKLADSGLFAYLKIAEARYESYFYEVNLLGWLMDKLPVPQVLYWERRSGMEYLLMSEIKGSNGLTNLAGTDPSRLVYCLARGLKMIHSIDIRDCPFDQRLYIKLRNAEYNVDNGLISRENLRKERRMVPPRRTLEILRQKAGWEEDLVFTHGDYCLPNIIVNNGDISGFIDWGRGGIADRYQDISLAYRTIIGNFGSPRLAELFFKYYGLGKVDRGKLEYFILLDSLF